MECFFVFEDRGFLDYIITCTYHDTPFWTQLDPPNLMIPYNIGGAFFLNEKPVGIGTFRYGQQALDGFPQLQ